MSRNSVVNFGKDAFVHKGRHIYHVDLDTEETKIVNEFDWTPARGCIPIT